MVRPRLLTGCFLVSLCAAGTAQAQLYFRADTGYSKSTGANFKDNDPNLNLICGNAACQSGQFDDFGGTVILSAGVGTRLNPNVRTDVTLGYRKYKLDQTDNGAPPTKFTADIKSLAVMANGYYDFSAGGVKPYAGIGIGAARNNLGAISFDDGAGFRGNVPGDTKTGFAFAVMLGASIPLGQTLVLDVGYRYTDLGDVKSKTNAPVTVNGVVVPPPYPGATGNLRANELVIGLRF